MRTLREGGICAGFITLTAVLAAAFVMASCETQMLFGSGGESAELPIIDPIGSSQNAVYTIGSSASRLIISAAPAGSGTLSFQWYRDPDGDKSTSVDRLTIPTSVSGSCVPETNVPGTFYYYCEVTNTIEDNGDGGEKSVSDLSDIVTIVINDRVNAMHPVISVQPKSKRYRFWMDTIPEALTITAAVTDGGALTYKWYSDSDGNAATDADRVFLADGVSYTPDISVMDSRIYYCCVITNQIEDNLDGGVKTSFSISDMAFIESLDRILAEAPVITAQPPGGTYTWDSPPATIPVTATSPDGGTITYKWYYNDINSNNTGSSSGAVIVTDTTGAELAFSPTAITPPETRYYFVAVTNTITDNGDGGAKSATVVSNTAKIDVIRVNAKAPVLFNMTGGPEFALGDTGAAWSILPRNAAELSAQPGSNVTYQWYLNTNNSAGPGSGAIAKGTSSTQSVDASVLGETSYFSVVVTHTISDNGDGGDKVSVVTSPAVLTKIVQPQPGGGL